MVIVYFSTCTVIVIIIVTSSSSSCGGGVAQAQTPAIKNYSIELGCPNQYQSEIQRVSPVQWTPSDTRRDLPEHLHRMNR